MLFNEETDPKNFTSNLKDGPFLDFFFKSLQKNNTNQFKEFTYISPCWGEMNFVKVHSSPVVFR